MPFWRRCMRVVFMGTPEYATTILKALLAWEGCEVVGVFTQPDKPAGRTLELRPPHVKAFVNTLASPPALFQPTSLKDPQTQACLSALAPDVIVVAAYGQLLPKAVLDIAPCINLHASLLPQYRGASPIQASILAGDAFTGVTAMAMDEGLDTGAMLGFTYLPLTPAMQAAEVFEALAQKAAQLSVAVLGRLRELLPLPQQGACASYAPKISKADGLVDFKNESMAIIRRFNALTPWPGLFLESGLKLLHVTLAQTSGTFTPGEILVVDEEGAVVGCAQGAVRIVRVQAPSKKPLHVKEYLAGKRMGVGALLS